jgi:hypothetical protein
MQYILLTDLEISRMGFYAKYMQTSDANSLNIETKLQDDLSNQNTAELLVAISPSKPRSPLFVQRACFGSRKPRYGRYFDGCQ